MKKTLYLSLFAALSVSALSVPKSYAQIISTIAGTGGLGFSGDGGPATAAQFLVVNCIGSDAAGNIYISDYTNSRIRKVDGTGTITTVIGTGLPGYAGDGNQASAAQINLASSVTIDGSGNIYFCDEGNSVIRKVDAAGIITTIAGTGVPGNSGDGGPATAATINTPQGLAVDGGGNIYFGGYFGSRVRKISAAGIITTVAGNGTPGYSGDGGPATAAKIYSAMGLAVDGSGNLYIADRDNHAIRKVDAASGIITTAAGNGTIGFNGDGMLATAASLNFPMDVQFDAAGNMYIADRGNERIRKVNTSGIISTVAGNGQLGYSGDGGDATAAKLSAPESIALTSAGAIYIADDSNNVVRKVTPGITGLSQVSANSSVSLFPNPNNGNFRLTALFSSAAAGAKVNVEVTNILGLVVYKNILPVQQGAVSAQINLDNIANGIYLLRISGEGEEQITRFAVNR